MIKFLALPIKILVFLVFIDSSQAFESKDKLVGNILKSTLESYHYKKLKINDSVSQKAFAQYIKKIDFGKQFYSKKCCIS